MTNTPLISCLQYFLYFSPHQGIHAITAWSAMHQNDIGMRTLPGVGRDKSRVTAWYLMTQVLLVSFRASPTCPSIRILRCHLYVDVDCTIQSMLVWIISISLGNSRPLTCCIAVAGLAIFLYVDQLMHPYISTPFLKKIWPSALVMTKGWWEVWMYLLIMFVPWNLGSLRSYSPSSDRSMLCSSPSTSYMGPSEGFVTTITEPTRQGGIVSIYYLGTLLGSLLGGAAGDRFVLLPP